MTGYLRGCLLALPLMVAPLQSGGDSTGVVQVTPAPVTATTTTVAAPNSSVASVAAPAPPAGQGRLPGTGADVLAVVLVGAALAFGGGIMTYAAGRVHGKHASAVQGGPCWTGRLERAM